MSKSGIARRWSWLLLLVAFLAVPFAVPPAVASVSPHATVVPSTADFLASPAPELKQTAGSCTSNGQCPAIP
jgi:hypothetical protein